MKRIYVIIPARSGSVGVTDKNILPVLGVPIIVRAYRVACSLPHDVRVIVSTDSSQYLRLVQKEGYSDLALRPTKLSTSSAFVIDTIQYELDRVGASNDDLIALLEPSFVGRRYPNLCKAIDMVNNNKADSCLGVYPVPAAFQLTKQFVRNNEGVKFIGPANVNRQQLPLSYVRSGEFYLSRVGLIREEQSLLGGRLEMLETALPFVNIDSVEDVERAINIPEKALD